MRDFVVQKLGLADEHATGNPKRVAGWLLNSLLQKAGSATSVASSPSFEEYRQAQAYSKTLCALCTKFFVADVSLLAVFPSTHSFADPSSPL